MDAKALAKSKRAHSLHHSKKPPHSSSKSKATSGSANNAGSGNKALGKQAKEKARQSGLPSNWDRYEEEFDSSFEDPTGDSINKATDVILPKSKGADFRHLIAEAQSQCQSNSHLDTFPSLDDILPGDFELGVGSMLSVRGESILSWIGDNNFIVDDETTAIPEASFLSLNLNALAEQLAKVDISKRLFIEADLLPSELADNGSKTSSSPDLDQVRTSETEATARVSKELAFEDFSEKNEVANQNTGVILSESTVNSHSNLNLLNQGSTVNSHSNLNLLHQGFKILNETKGYLNSSQDVKISQSSTCEVQVNPKKLPTFEVTTPEAELDVLLDSFRETKLLDSSGFKSGAFPVFQKQATTQHNRSNLSSTFSKTTVVAAKLDDALDELLEETSFSSNRNSSYQLGKVTAVPNAIQSSSSSSSSQPATKSKVLDDFDSWLDTI